MAKKRWWGAELEALRADYANWKMPLREIALKYKTNPGQIARLRLLHRWPMRVTRNPTDRIKRLKARREYLRRRIRVDETEIMRIDARIRVAGVLDAKA